MSDEWKTSKDKIDRRTGKKVRYRGTRGKEKLPRGLIVVSPSRHTTDTMNLYGERVSFIDDDGNEVHGKVTNVDAWEDHVPIEYEIEDDDGELWAVSPDDVKYVTTRAKLLKRRAERKKLVREHYLGEKRYKRKIAGVKRRIRGHLDDPNISVGFRNELEALLRSLPE